MTIISAAALAIPLAFIAWFEVGYLLFGATGEDSSGPAKLAIGLVAYAGTIIGLVRAAERPAEVVRRAGQLGIALSIALPIVTVAVLLMWANADGRRDLGMGGLMLYSLPVVAFVAAVVLVILFGIVRRLAQKRLQANVLQ